MADPLRPATQPLRWVCECFDTLGVHALHDALALRCRVFILEQGPYQDPDAADKHAWHLLGYSAADQLLACLRIVDPGARYAEPSIGRVVTAPEVRGQGLGLLLMEEGLAHCERLWPGRAVRISAQAHLQAFYGALGFVAAGVPYLEDGIPHVEMLRPWPTKETP
ncbi:MAG: GNAT family N-acetyltransferase [Giesbergeria sp.]